jgi:hypothetical protein
MALFFNAGHMPQPAPEYVAWVDVMGTQASMSAALKVAANFIFKLHIAALQAPHANVRIYPVMDGFYASAPGKDDMLEFLRSVFSEVAATFNAEAENRFRFVIRGALSYGPVVHGGALPPQCSPALAANGPYRDHLLLGMPMVQSHLSETHAPPFGVYVHESARAFAPPGQSPLIDRWWSWSSGATHATWAALPTELEAYYDWCDARAGKIDYLAERIGVHRRTARQYFA